MSTETSVLGNTKKKMNDILHILEKIKADFSQEEIAVYNAKIFAVNQDLDQLEFFVRDIHTSIFIDRNHD
jgi:hypothetical protein